ncbi:hypothetical protein D3C73_1458710 [compost metagenome]
MRAFDATYFATKHEYKNVISPDLGIAAPYALDNVRLCVPWGLEWVPKYQLGFLKPVLRLGHVVVGTLGFVPDFSIHNESVQHSEMGVIKQHVVLLRSVWQNDNNPLGLMS